MRGLSSQGQLHHPSTTPTNVMPHSSLSSSLSNLQSSTIDRTGQNGTSAFFPKSSSATSQQNHLTKSDEEYHYNFSQCPLCQESYQRCRAQILPCFHSLCETCVEKLVEKDEGSIICPSCGTTTLAAEILPDCTLQSPDEHLSNPYMVSLGDNSSQCCTACKSTESMAVAKCFHCSSFLCHQCVCAHEIMNCFEGHHVSNEDSLSFRHGISANHRSFPLAPSRLVLIKWRNQRRKNKAFLSSSPHCQSGPERKFLFLSIADWSNRAIRRTFVYLLKRRTRVTAQGSSFLGMSNTSNKEKERERAREKEIEF